MIYHHDDEDGWGSAAAATLKYPDAETAQCTFGKEPELVSGYDEVYVLDFSFTPDEMRQLSKQNGKLIWIDHHESKLKDISEDYPGIRDVSKAACQLSWEYCFPEKDVPLVLQHIADEDIWEFKLKETAAFNKFLSANFQEGKEIELIRNIIEEYTTKDYEDAYDKGALLKQFQDHQIQEQLKRGVKKTFLGHPAMVFFSNINTSQLGNAALVHHKDIEIAVMIFLLESKTGEVEYKYSLRSKGAVNVGQLCAKHGGGGHPKAAGFVSKTLVL